MLLLVNKILQLFSFNSRYLLSRSSLGSLMFCFCFFFAPSLPSMFCHLWSREICCEQLKPVDTGGCWQRIICFGGRSAVRKLLMRRWSMAAGCAGVTLLPVAHTSLFLCASLRLSIIGGQGSTGQLK